MTRGVLRNRLRDINSKSVPNIKMSKERVNQIDFEEALVAVEERKWNYSSTILG